MYDWLADAVAESPHLVTASRRLARQLHQEHGRQQAAAGKSAWRTPAISSWQDWLKSLLATAGAPQDLPTRINPYQSRLLWERCLRREISDPLLNMALLARQSGEAHARLTEWRVPLDDCSRAAVGKDKNVFARAAHNYESILSRERWVDQAGLAELATNLVVENQLALPARVLLAGFDRIVPQVEVLLGTLRRAGCAVDILPARKETGSISLHQYENSDAELRAAGAWARDALQSTPHARIAVVVSDLERDAPRAARLVKEGLVPGWQTAGFRHGNSVNVSYGRKLASYPAIEIALLALRWLNEDLSTADIGQLLRTPILGKADTDGRGRLESRLRQIPDRAWSPHLFVAAMKGSEHSSDSSDWITRIESLNAQKDEQPKRLAPSGWAALFHEVLTSLNWPGDKSLNSSEFQLLNRWRELLNDLAHLEVVSPTLTLADALARVSTMARETVFQPEAESAVVQVLGPLEAAGMEFDGLWIVGCSADHWPPAGKPLALVSRDLQRTLGMPDAEPHDTHEYALRVVSRLVKSAEAVVCSYPRVNGDAEQTVTGLLAEHELEETPGPLDPHWNATQLRKTNSVVLLDSDPVPGVEAGELVSGGAATIQRQFVEPFSAFVFGRLGVRLLYRISTGLAANIRGNLVHDALYGLYEDLPSSHDIGSWSEDEIGRRLKAAVGKSFLIHERHADPVLNKLLTLEKARVDRLLRGVVAADAARSSFRIVSVEGTVDAQLQGVLFRFRHDRIDQVNDGHVVILDYKTGSPRRLLDRNGEPRDMQLIAYACGIDEPVAGIGLVNIDSRAINFDGAGEAFRSDPDWAEKLMHWRANVMDAARDIGHGDVRINASQTVQAARPLGLLSRFRELNRDA